MADIPELETPDLRSKVGVGIAPDGRIRFASGPTDFDPLASGWGDVSWQEVKKKQLKYGVEFWHSPDNPNPEGTGYPEANFPMIRCFWHMENPDDQNEAHVVNLSVQSKPFDSGPQWEKLSRP